MLRNHLRLLKLISAALLLRRGNQMLGLRYCNLVQLSGEVNPAPHTLTDYVYTCFPHESGRHASLFCQSVPPKMTFSHVHLSRKACCPFWVERSSSLAVLQFARPSTQGQLVIFLLKATFLCTNIFSNQKALNQSKAFFLFFSKQR